MKKRGLSTKKAEKAKKELEDAAKFLYKATEDYLHSVLDLAKFHSSGKVKQVKPHILKIAKHADEFYEVFAKRK